MILRSRRVVLLIVLVIVLFIILVLVVFIVFVVFIVVIIFVVLLLLLGRWLMRSIFVVFVLGVRFLCCWFSVWFFLVVVVVSVIGYSDFVSRFMEDWLVLKGG